MENDVLRERIAQLEDLLGMRGAAPIEFALTPSEERVFGVLMQRDLATKEAVMAACYANRGADEAEQKIVDVFICKIRRKIKPFAIKIETAWGRGYFIPASDKKRVREMIAQFGAAA